MSHKYLITEVSKNKKVGPMMVTTSPRKTCSDACPFKDGPCYAESGPLAFLWHGLDRTDPMGTFKNGKGAVTVASSKDLLKSIRKLFRGQGWRHNQAGDLAGEGDSIDLFELCDIVEANEAAGARGFTYTHKPVFEHLYDTAKALAGQMVKVSKGTTDHYTAQGNRKAIEMANRRGFTINLSANDLDHADQLADLNIGPVATVLPHDHKGNTVTPKGRKVVQCPATRDGEKYAKVNCKDCMLCALQRDFIVGFPAHGASKKKASAIAAGK